MCHVPVCVSCRIEMKIERNGVKWVSYANFGPYQIWDSDKWKCSSCGLEVLVGFGQRRLAEHYESDFSERLAMYEKTDKVIHERIKEEVTNGNG